MCVCARVVCQAVGVFVSACQYSYLKYVFISVMVIPKKDQANRYDRFASEVLPVSSRTFILHVF